MGDLALVGHGQFIGLVALQGEVGGRELEFIQQQGSLFGLRPVDSRDNSFEFDHALARRFHETVIARTAGGKGQATGKKKKHAKFSHHTFAYFPCRLFRQFIICQEPSGWRQAVP